VGMAHNGGLFEMLRQTDGDARARGGEKGPCGRSR